MSYSVRHRRPPPPAGPASVRTSSLRPAPLLITESATQSTTTSKVSLTADDCPISAGTVTLTLPDGTVQTLATGVSLGPGGVEDFDQATIGLPEYVIAGGQPRCHGRSHRHDGNERHCY